MRKTLVEALFSRNYICPSCGGQMEFEDEFESMLVCPACGESMDLDDYGTTEEEDSFYSVMEDVLDIDDEDEDDSGEWYEEVCGELDD